MFSWYLPNMANIAPSIASAAKKPKDPCQMIQIHPLSFFACRLFARKLWNGARKLTSEIAFECIMLNVF